MFQKIKLVGGYGDVEVERTTPFKLICAATTNQTIVKAGPAVLVAIIAINVNAAVRYLKFYDTRDKPTAGAGSPIRIMPIPGNTAGAGFVFTPVIPMGFNYGIGFTIVTGIADSDSTAPSANDVALTLEYI